MYSEKITVGAGTDYPLKGLLTFPDDLSGPLPAVVMVHGSGASNMDEKVMKLKPFKDLAEGLAGHGVASLRYDKRTYAHGFKLIRQKNFTVTVKEETIEDAILAIKMLKNDPRIDCDRIFILGHSMGAMLAPRIDAEGADVKGLILMAGTPNRLEDIVLRQLKQAGGSSSILKWIAGMYYLNLNFIDEVVIVLNRLLAWELHSVASAKNSACQERTSFRQNAHFDELRFQGCPQAIAGHTSAGTPRYSPCLAMASFIALIESLTSVAWVLAKYPQRSVTSLCGV